MKKLIVLMIAVCIASAIGVFAMYETSLSSSQSLTYASGLNESAPIENVSKEIKPIMTYDYNTNTTCIGKVCTVAIGWSYAYDIDNTWKLIDEAKSLRNSSVSCNVISDGINIADCLDWNTTSITVNMSSKSAGIVPVKVYSPNVTKNRSEMTGNYKKDYMVKSSYAMSFASKEAKVQIFPFRMGDIMEFGENSTILYLNESNGGIVDDGDAYSWEPTTYFDTNYMQIQGDGTNRARGLVKGNLSIIPAGSIITNANQSLYIPSLAPSHTIYHEIYNTTDTWIEETLTWNNMPAAGTLQDNRTITTSTGVWRYFNVTNAAVTAFANATDKNLSLMIKFYLENSGSADYMRYSTKEGATASQRPQLVVTYGIGDTTLPTYNANSTNTTLAGKPTLFSLNWTDNVGLDGYIFSFCNGTWNGTICNYTANTIYTLPLNDSNGGNLRDVLIFQPGPDTNYGTIDYTQINDKMSASERAQFMFNISGLPSNITIISATFYLYEYTIGTDTKNASLYHVTSHTWQSASTGNALNETTITFNNQTCGTLFTNSTYCNLTMEGFNLTTMDSIGMISWSATNMVTNEYNNGDKNVSFVLRTFETGSSTHSSQFYTKEKSTTSLRPQLVITYNMSSSFNWANDSFVSMTGATNWSNITKVVNSTVGAKIAWCVYASDSAGNWNGTSCQNPFSYVTTAADTCTYTSGNWAIDCKDNCNITDKNITGALIIYSTGAGWVNLTNVNATGMTENYTNPCYVIRSKLAT
jgi:hypothetical protein